jgi:hypothetical protein
MSQPTIQTTLLGRLGNQMFTYAATRVMALDNGCHLQLTEEWIRAHNVTCRLDCFNLSDNVTFAPSKRFSALQKIGYFIYMLKCRHKDINQVADIEKKYQKFFNRFGLILNQEGYLKPLKLRARNFYALGYLQSDMFFSKYEKIIRKELSFRDEKLSSAALLLGEKLKSSNSVCLHIRMGDYMNDPIFGVCGLDYYYRAIKRMKELLPNAVYYIFSDNVEKAKEALSKVDGISLRVIDAKYNDQESLYLGICCRNFIMSNSTFSWWMQYLSDNKNKIVVAPNKWYNTKRPCDIYQENWKLVEV